MGNVFNRYGAGGGKSEGLYIWKKYAYFEEQTVTNPTIVLDATSSSSYKVTSDDFNLMQLPYVTSGSGSTALNESLSADAKTIIDFFDGFKSTDGNLYNIYKYNGELRVGNNSYAYTIWRHSNTSGASYLNRVSTTSYYHGGTTTMQYDGTKTLPAKIGDMVGYVVSDKEDAYPHKEVMGDYYYERIIFDEAILGGSKIETGSFYLSSATNIYTVNHNLGVIPKFAYAWKSAQVNGAKRLANVYTGTGTQAIVESYVQDGNATVSTGGTSKATTTTAVFNTYSTNTAYTMTGTWQYILIG